MTHDADSLTPRELEVLELAGAGLGDDAIAEQLGIARSTVGMLLRSSKAKLGAERDAFHPTTQEGVGE